MTKKLFKNRLAAALGAKALATKQSFAADAGAATVELALLPVLPGSPFQTFEGDIRGGVQFVIDSAMVETFNATTRKANLNIEHNRGSGDTRSRGYCAYLTNAEAEPETGMEPGVTYGWFALSALGKQELAGGLWLYTSAEISGRWIDENTFLIVRFTGCALTNNPATEMPANFSEQTEEDSEDAAQGPGYTSQTLTEDQMNLLEQLLAKLGMTAETPPAEVLARVDSLTAEPTANVAEAALTAAGFTAVDVPGLVRTDALTAAQTQFNESQVQLTAVQVELTAAAGQVVSLTTQLTALQASNKEQELAGAVDAVILKKFATPGQRDGLLANARASGLEAFNAQWLGAIPVLAANAKAPEAAANSFGLNAEDLAKAKTAGITPETYATVRDQARVQLGL